MDTEDSLTTWETEEVLSSLDEIEAGLVSMRGYYGAVDPASEAPKIFALMGGGDRIQRVRVTRAILEGIFDWNRWNGMSRCHCGDRATDLFWRLKAARAGEPLPEWGSDEADSLFVRYA